MGTPDFAVPSLHAVHAACEIAAVVTQPDRGRGRGQHASSSDVGAAAAALGLPVLKPEKVNAPELVGALAAFAPDLFAVVAFGSLLGPALLAVPRLGSINLHGSLLPAYRGAAPVQRALWDGLSVTGVTTMWLDEGLDTGDMILARELVIDPGEDAGHLSTRLAALGAPVLSESLVLAFEGRAPRKPQPAEGVSYAKKMKKKDGWISFDADPVAIWNRQRAVTPWPGATVAYAGHALRIETCAPEPAAIAEAPPGTVLAVDREGVRVACAPGALRLLRVRPASRPVMSAAEWARGARIAPGDRLLTVREEAA
jgi:methionyl-tRNA formyltransferase